jgi:hypothetical protein
VYPVPVHLVQQDYRSSPGWVWLGWEGKGAAGEKCVYDTKSGNRRGSASEVGKVMLCINGDRRLDM